jgi:hypothetical protein
MEKPVDAHYLALEGGATVCKHCGKPMNDQGLAKVSHLSKCKPPKLRTWNGRGDYRQFKGRFYVCAPTKKLAVELLKTAGHVSITMREFTGYYSEAWGIYMKDVTPEIGVWYDEPSGGGHDAGKPKRIL